MKGSEDYYYGSGSSADYDSYDDFDLKTLCGKGGSAGAKRGGGKASGSMRSDSNQTGTAYSQKHIRLREARKGCVKRK